MTDEELHDKAIFPFILHVERISPDNDAGFQGKACNARDATHAILTEEDYQHMAKLAVEGRISALAYDELRGYLKRIFELCPEAVHAYYVAGSEKTEEAKKDADIQLLLRQV